MSFSMKNKDRVIVMSIKNLFYSLLLLMIVSCSRDNGEITTPPAKDVINIITTGEQVFKELVTSLSSELSTAINTGGLKAAINTCNIRAIPITTSIYEDNKSILNIKRTSFNIRNKNNKPDGYEKKALRYFEELEEFGKKFPSYYVQKIQEKDDVFFRYYKPLLINELCLNCHGVTDRMSADILQELGELYPDDHANGYELNNFRGVVSITISDEVQ